MPMFAPMSTLIACGKVSSAVSLGLNRGDIQLETRAVNADYSAVRVDGMKSWEMAVVLVERNS